MSKQHTAWSVVFAAIILLVLAVMPARAQELGGAASDTLYLPAVMHHVPQWFTDAELTDAMIRDGYDPDVAGMHVNCILHVTAVPPHLIRYSSCNQYFITGIGPTEDAVPAHYILWQKLSDGIVHSTEVGG